MADSAPASANAAPVDAVAALAAQADARLQQVLQQMLTQSAQAGDVTAALSEQIRRQQAASVASATAANFHVFEIADQHRRVALREVTRLNDRDPIDPQGCTFAAAVSQLNASLRDPLIEKPQTIQEIAQSLLDDFRVAGELPPFPGIPPTPPAHASAR